MTVSGRTEVRSRREILCGQRCSPRPGPASEAREQSQHSHGDTRSWAGKWQWHAIISLGEREVHIMFSIPLIQPHKCKTKYDDHCFMRGVSYIWIITGEKTSEDGLGLEDFTEKKFNNVGDSQWKLRMFSHSKYYPSQLWRGHGSHSVCTGKIYL